MRVSSFCCHIYIRPQKNNFQGNLYSTCSKKKKKKKKTQLDCTKDFYFYHYFWPFGARCRSFDRKALNPSKRQPAILNGANSK
jgi:hypothetical protein